MNKQFKYSKYFDMHDMHDMHNMHDRQASFIKPPMEEQAAVSLLKARIKDRSQITSLLALDLLNQCMQLNGDQLEFQLCVIEKVLKRILKLALPNKGNHPRVQQKVAHLIKYWSSAYSNDTRLNEFVLAGKELAKRRERAKATAPPPRSSSASSSSTSKVTTPEPRLTPSVMAF